MLEFGRYGLAAGPPVSVRRHLCGKHAVSLVSRVWRIPERPMNLVRRSRFTVDLSRKDPSRPTTQSLASSVVVVPIWRASCVAFHGAKDKGGTAPLSRLHNARCEGSKSVCRNPSTNER